MVPTKPQQEIVENNITEVNRPTVVNQVNETKPTEAKNKPASVSKEAEEAKITENNVNSNAVEPNEVQV